jgi:hypothetical protein
VIAADYPFLNILWSMIIFFCWVVWIWITQSEFDALKAKALAA